MRGFRILWASSAGFMVDYLLSLFLVGGLSWYLAGVENFQDLNLANPIHILIGLVLPVVMSAIGGGVAGAMAPTDAPEAGALVGGLGLLFMTAGGLQSYGQHALAMIISQCVAVVLAAGAGILVARYLQSRV